MLEAQLRGPDVPSGPANSDKGRVETETKGRARDWEETRGRSRTQRTS